MLGRPGRGNHGVKIARKAHRAAAETGGRRKSVLQTGRCGQGAPSVQPRRPSPGMVEAALAAFAHEVRTPLTGILAISDLLATSDLDERERRWVDTIKAGAEHLASLATLFVDAAEDRNRRVRRPAGSVRPAGAGAQCRRFAGRPGGGERPAVGGRHFGKAAGARGRRSRSAARGAGKPDRQCGEVHRTGRRRAQRCRRVRGDARARSASPSRFPTAELA